MPSWNGRELLPCEKIFLISIDYFIFYYLSYVFFFIYFFLFYGTLTWLFISLLFCFDFFLPIVPLYFTYFYSTMLMFHFDFNQNMVINSIDYYFLLLFSFIVLFSSFLIWFLTLWTWRPQYPSLSSSIPLFAWHDTCKQRLCSLTFTFTYSFSLSLIPFLFSSFYTCIHFLCSNTTPTFRSRSDININVEQMNQIITSGVLQIWIEKVRSSVVSLSGGRQSETSRHNLQTVALEIAEMKLFIDKMRSQ